MCRHEWRESGKHLDQQWSRLIWYRSPVAHAITRLLRPKFWLAPMVQPQVQSDELVVILYIYIFISCTHDRLLGTHRTFQSASSGVWQALTSLHIFADLSPTCHVRVSRFYSTSVPHYLPTSIFPYLPAPSLPTYLPTSLSRTCIHTSTHTHTHTWIQMFLQGLRPHKVLGACRKQNRRLRPAFPQFNNLCDAWNYSNVLMNQQVDSVHLWFMMFFSFKLKRSL